MFTAPPLLLSLALAKALGAPAPLAHDAWTPDNGLPQVSVQALLQDHRGYLWVGTQEGLARFDGLRFDVMDRRNTPQLTQHNITSLAESADHTLWVGTRGGGVLAIRGERVTRYGTSAGLLSETVTALAPSDQGLWVGTDRGLALLSEDKARVIGLGSTLGEVTDLLVRSDGSLLVAALTGFYSVRDGAMEPLTLGLSAEVHPLSVSETRSGDVWLGTSGDGAFRWSEAGVEPVAFATGHDLGTVYDVLEDRAGAVWVATLLQGVVRIDPDGERTPFGPVEGLTYPRVTSLLEDLEGSLWIGTYGGGLNRLRAAPFATLSTREGLANREVWCVYPDLNGDLWFGTEAGLSLYRDGAITPFPQQEEFAELTVMTLLRDQAGPLWVGTWGRGLRRVLPDGRVEAIEEGLPDQRIYHLAQAPDGAVWAATQGGLVRFDADGELQRFGADEGLPHVDTRQVLWDQRGRQWVATKGGLGLGLSGSFRELVPDGVLFPPHTAIHGMTLAPDGTLWVASAAGLLRLRDERWGMLSMADGLPDDTIHELVVDELGDLWCSTNRGVFRLDTADLDAFFRGELHAVTAEVFGRDDGMLSAECDGGSHPAGARSSDGRIWFPTIEGVVSISPDTIPRNEVPPPVLIEGVNADGRQLSLTGALVLPPGTRDLEIQYAGLSLIDSADVQFRYHLEGLDEEAHHAGARRVVHFANLGAGRYTFRVEARNSDGVWSAHPASLSFTILPHPTQTWWFRGLVLSVLTLIAWGAVHQWTEAARRRERELLRAVEERTAELREMAEQFEQLSVHDTLTGLYNRRYLLDTVGKALDIRVERCAKELAALRRRNQDKNNTMAVYMVDIDHFKQVNDTWGHDAGDAVLRQFAAVLQSCARADDIVARWGGEEFLVVLPRADGRCLGAFAERLRVLVERTDFVLPSGEIIHRTASLGFARSPLFADGPCLSLEQIAAAADLGLYHAKKGGRNRSVHIQAGHNPPQDAAHLGMALSRLEVALADGVLQIGPLECSDACCGAPERGSAPTKP
ncbi:MAG: diguanylate cyclase [Deltaproteobacteria bacterium]|nr:diguanylate cyclase [Deltaproteobacteria bacterium]